MAENIPAQDVRIVVNESNVTDDDPLPIISAAHKRIHQGVTFIAGHYINNVADDASLELLIQVGANKTLHMIFSAAAGADAEVTLYENPTFSDARTALTAFNKARYSTGTSDATITHTPTLTDDGTAFPTRLIPGGSGGNAIGGTDGGFDRGIDLKKGNDYLVRVKNIGGGAKPVSSTLEWYEV